MFCSSKRLVTAMAAALITKTQPSIVALSLVVVLATTVKAQTFDRVTIKEPTTYYAGPTWLNVGSDVPARMWVIWPPVSNAAGYRISRSTGGTMVPVNTIALSEVYGGYPGPDGDKYPHVLPSDDSLTLYSFQVNAFFLNGTDTTWSGPSPAASARSIPNRPPANLRYTVKQSTMKPFVFSVTLSWDKWYTGVRGYKIRISTGGTVAAEYSAIPSTLSTVTVDAYRTTTESIGQLSYEVRRFQQTTICVSTQWPTATVPLSPWACTPTIN